ncbi:MAG TPA: NAD(P)H-hydrate epimerase [Anaerolineales bacterium]|jgi:NAD(P)H-hydrate epimerase
MDALTPPNITLSTAQMIEVDRAMLEEYHITLIQMMENAGRGLAHLARERFLGGDPRGKNVIVLAGAGGNGGGALVSARRLHNWGALLAVVLSKTTGEYRGAPAQQLDSLQRMGIPLLDQGSFHTSAGVDLVLDGLIGYNLSGSPRGTTARLIEWANGQKAPILSLDVPSGLDSTTGKSHVPTIRAAATLTLALPKTGLLRSEASRFVGELYLADISVPPELYKKAFGLTIPALFAQNEIIRLKA